MGIYACFTGILALVLLGCCWWLADLEVRTKIIITIAYFLTWPLIFISPWLTIAAQAVFSIIVGYMTFGSTWGTR